MEEIVYLQAFRYNDDVVFYFDAAGNKFVATGGNLAWRINNPGLVRGRSGFSRSQGSIGCCGPYAIFATAQDGQNALIAWLRSKKYLNSSLRLLAAQYAPIDPDAFARKLSLLTKISPDRTVKSLTDTEFQSLVKGIEKLCGYAKLGNESFTLLPKICAKIENGKGKEDTYLLEDNTVCSKNEAIDLILKHRVDAVIVHERNGSIHLRSRPHHCIWNIKTHESVIPPSEGKIDPLVRVVGEKRPGQCLWAYINGIDNTKAEAQESCELISKAAGGEEVLSMPNDTIWGPIDASICIALKTSIDTPMIAWTVKFLRYLLHKAKQEENPPPVIIFAHSQGAIFIEHALKLLSSSEKDNLIIFTFGGGSFITPGTCHPDSHNYASTADYVCILGSPNHQLLALERYHERKKGLSDEKIAAKFAYGDAMLHLDSTDPRIMNAFIAARTTYYEKEFFAIRNLTILDPDPDSRWKHKFKSDCYQRAMQAQVKKYQKSHGN